MPSWPAGFHFVITACVAPGALSALIAFGGARIAATGWTENAFLMFFFAAFAFVAALAFAGYARRYPMQDNTLGESPA